MKKTCHPRLGVVSDSANSPVGFCSEQPAAAGNLNKNERNNV